jgi:hypothetical protein
LGGGFLVGGGGVGGGGGGSLGVGEATSISAEAILAEHNEGCKEEWASCGPNGLRLGYIEFDMGDGRAGRGETAHEDACELQYTQQGHLVQRVEIARGPYTEIAESCL